MTEEINQREIAINLCRELAIEENEQVLRVIVYALEKWTNPVRINLDELLDKAARQLYKADKSGGIAAKMICLRNALSLLRKDLRESTSPPPESPDFYLIGKLKCLVCQAKFRS